MSKHVTGFLDFLFRPFFRAWWALATGAASFLAWLVTPAQGWSLSPIGALIITLLVATSLFLTLSVVVRGWYLWRDSFPHLMVSSVQRDGSPGGGWQFVLSGHVPDAVGTLVDIHRRMGEIEAPFALVEIASVTSQGKYQARSISTSAGHVREYAKGLFTVGDMVARPQVRAERVRAALNDFAETEVER